VKIPENVLTMHKASEEIQLVHYDVGQVFKYIYSLYNTYNNTYSLEMMLPNENTYNSRCRHKDGGVD
jgi:hypothetical protein